MKNVAVVAWLLAAAVVPASVLAGQRAGGDVLQYGPHPRWVGVTGAYFQAGGAIQRGPDGAPWVLDNGLLYRVDMYTGGTTSLRFSGASGTFAVGSFAAPPGGPFFLQGKYAHGSSVLAVASTTGAILHTATSPSGDVPISGVIAGSDGNGWFMEAYHYAKITSAGTITEYCYESFGPSCPVTVT